MELVTMYFWVVKLAFTAIVLYVCYVAFLKYKFKSIIWNVSAIAL